MIAVHEKYPIVIEILVPILVLLPGYTLLSAALPASLLSVAATLGLSCVISTLLLTLTQLPRWARHSARLTKFYLIATAIFALPAGKFLAAAWIPGSNLLTLHILIAGMIFFLWTWFSRNTRIPGELELGLGDTVAYYRIADNLRRTGLLTEDYHVGDYPAGIYGYMSSLPVPACLIAFFHRVVGPNIRSLAVYNMLSGVIAALLFADLAATDLNIKLVCFTLFLILPANWAYFSVGAHSSSGIMGILLVCVLQVMPLPVAVSIPLTTLVVAYLLLLRPEGQFWLLLSGGMFVITAPGNPAIGVTGVLAGVIIVWVLLPELFFRFSDMLYTMGIFHLQRQPNSLYFGLPYPHWSGLNKDFARFHATGSWPDQKLQGRAVGKELQSHPCAFLLYVARQFILTTCTLVRGLYRTMPAEIGSPSYWHATWGIGVMCALLALGPLRLAVLTSIAYLILLPLLNEGRGVRHVFLVAGLLLASALRLLDQAWPFQTYVTHREALLASLALLAIRLPSGIAFLRSVRRSSVSSRLADCMHDIAAYIPPSSEVYCSYPQLFSYFLDCPCAGSTFMGYFIESALRRKQYEFVIFDNLRGHNGSYATLAQRLCMLLPGYSILIHDAQNQWIIYKRDTLTPSAAPATTKTISFYHPQFTTPDLPVPKNWRIWAGSFGIKTAPLAYLAAERGELTTVLGFVQNGLDINATNHEGRSLLMAAANCGHFDLLRMLLAHGANPNHQDVNYITPVMTAARSGYAHIIRILHHAGAGLYGRNKFGHSALSWAIKWNKTESALYLIEQGSCTYEEDIDGVTPLEWAYTNQMWSVLGALLKTGVWNSSQPLFRIMHAAVSDNNVTILRMCLDNLTDRSIHGPFGLTPMHLAAHLDYPHILDLCSRMGSSPDSEDIHGSTPLMYAARQGNRASVTTLVSLGADVYHRDSNAANALSWAQRHGQEEIASIIAEFASHVLPPSAPEMSCP